MIVTGGVVDWSSRRPQAAGVQARVDAVLSERETASPHEPFSAFRLEDVQRAKALTASWMAMDGVEPVLEAAERALEAENPDLVRFALISYLIHHPHASGLGIPPLAVRFPYKVVPSVSPSAPDAALQAVFANPELRLAWWREDPGLNEHQELWHVVYNPAGVPPDGERKDRHGELFLYVHRQMLARYDTERRALRIIDPVQAWWPYTVATDPWGFDPGRGLAAHYRARGPNQKWQDIAQISAHRQRLADGIEKGDLADASALGAALEGWTNEGLALFASMGAPTELPGVMDDVATAARDHLFWRWHKGVDDLYAAWQAKQPPHDLSDAPTVVMRKQIAEPFAPPTSANLANRSPDIILSRVSQIPEDWREHLQEFGEAVFGGEHWDEEFASTSYTTSELQTTMRDGVLGHDDFVYFLRVDNQGFDPAGITVRVFLAAQEVAEERRMWMEMDKFRWVLKRSERVVICRPASLSSVIRKAGTPTAGDTDYCDCGWPANLLVPRGRSDGMRFRLLVMLTDWSIDRVAPASACGSPSFYGSRDRYPDTRPMGYPFDRPLADDRTISQLVAAQPNLATRDITIRWMPAG